MTTDFPAARDDDEFLHPVDVTAHPGLTETSYFHFNIPEAGLTGEVYVWFHTRLRMISSGIWIWRGMKRDRLAAEYFDYRAFLPYHIGQIDSYTTPLGVRVRVIKPLQEIHLEFDDADRDVHFRMVQQGLTAPILRARAFDFEGNFRAPIQGGFEQPMKVDGELRLAGQTHRIDGYSIRDRSWNQVRDEVPRSLSPFTWLAAITDGSFAFCLGAYDDPARNPEWKHHLPESPAGGFVHGWIHRDGEIRRLASVSKLTRRDRGLPLSHTLEMHDSTGRAFRFDGIVQSALPIVPWPNMTAWCGLTRWECEGRIAWGDTQECQWTDYVRLFG